MEAIQNELNLEKLIVFDVAEYHLALPIAEVLQVINHPTVTDELTKTGLVLLGHRMIRCLDLHQQLADDSIQVPQNRPFLVITQMLGELYAIPVSEPPNVIEFPLEMMQLLPQSQSGLLKIASHAAGISSKYLQGVEDELTATLFLLDIQRILTPIAPALLPNQEEQRD
ncbi:chemotaxis protein CheW [Phormidesmis priestleyi]